MTPMAVDVTCVIVAGRLPKTAVRTISSTCQSTDVAFSKACQLLDRSAAMTSR